jgi:CRISPR/Cas system-associated exonuclease Cas4 (RecB family)
MVFVWSASKIDDATYCPRLFYYKHVRKMEFPTNGLMALGIFIHRVMEKSFYNDGGKPRYKTADSFANAMAGRWKRYIIKTGKIRRRKISWRDEKEPWVIANYDIPLLCKNAYEVCSQEKRPLFKEAKFDFELDGRKYRGKIDAIAKRDDKIIIRDYKSGRRKPRQMKLDFDPQFTLYFLAVGCLCYGDKRFAEALEISDEVRARWAGNPVYLPDIIQGEYFLMREKELLPMTRRDCHYYDFCNMLEGLENMVRDEEFEPHRGRLCDYCEARGICREETETEEGRLRKRQFSLFQAPKFVSIGSSKEKIKQLRLKWPR